MEKNVFEQKNSKSYNPLVSIITPVLNGIDYLEPCIQSVITQSYPYIEHIFVDGGSSDGTLDMLKSYQAKYPDRIKLILQTDKGVGRAWNMGLRASKGEIFGWLGSDDMSEPGAIAAVVEFFRSHPDAYFVFGDCNYINEKGEMIGKYITKDFDFDELINERCYVPTPSSFYKREVFEKVGFYTPKGNDYEYLIRVANVFQIYRIERVLSNFRSHSKSQTGAKETLRMWMRDDCMASRRNGGRFFSGYCKRYYMFAITESLRPILGPFYPSIKRVIKIAAKKKQLK